MRRNCTGSRLLAAFAMLVLVCAAGAAGENAALAPIDFEKIITTAKEKVFPALVFVKPIRESYETGEKERQEVFGSGVIVSPEGLVVTNNHVVEKAIQINCVLWNKEQVGAKLLGKDEETDLALLKLEWKGDKPLPYAEFQDSDKLTEGQFVMALGAPFGFTRSISLGILSNTQRYIGFRTMYKYNLWLQTDAAINPGNSGGPLVSTEGKIVGINTIGLAWGEMGFSIPSNDVKRIVQRLEKDGRVVRSRSGIELQALKDFDSNTFIDSSVGVLIKGLEEGSPAAEAGLKSGDILLGVNGEKINGTYVEQLPYIRWALDDLPAAKPAEMTVRRHGETINVSVTPVPKGKYEGEDLDCRRWNMTVKGITKHANPTLYFYRKTGVFIRAVKYPGNANTAGLRNNDILLEIAGKEVGTVDEVKTVYEALLADEKREKKVLITILRDGLRMPTVLDYRKDYDKED